MIFKSRLCGGHSINSKTAWSSFRFKYLLNLFAVCLGSLSCWKVKCGPINRLPDCMAWWMKICLYFSAFIIPSILTKSQLHQLKYNPKLVSILHHVLLLDVNRVLVTLSHFFFVYVLALLASKNLELWLVTRQHLPLVRIPVIVFSRILQSFGLISFSQKRLSYSNSTMKTVPYESSSYRR